MIFRKIGFTEVEYIEKLLRDLRLRVVLLIMEGSDIAVPRIISEILKLAFAVHWLDEIGERFFEKRRLHTAWGEGLVLISIPIPRSILNFFR